MTLKCIAEGKTKPNITWTRLSDNSVATMPLTNISRHDATDYRGKANNGVGTAAKRDVSIVCSVPKCCNEQTCTHIDIKCVCR